MNTKRALIVVMVLLVLMNMVLGAYLLSIRNKRNKFIDTELYAAKILSQRNIDIRCSIPDMSPEASSIVLGDMIYSENAIKTLKAKTGGEYRIDNRGRLIFTNSPTKKTVQGEMNRSIVESISHDYIKSIGLQIDDFTLDFFSETATDEYRVSYVSKNIEGIYYFDSYIKMIVTDFGVVSSEIYVRSLPDSKEIQGNSIPLYTILLTKLDAELKPMIIERINYGYHQKSDFSVDSVMSWRVRFNDGSERFFEVGSGNEITHEQEILEFNSIKLDCNYPKPFRGRETILYGDSVFNKENIELNTVFSEGKTKFEDNGIITYSRTTYENSRTYNLNKETITNICNEFILNIGLNPQDFFLANQIPDEGGIHQIYYVQIDSDGNLYFDNYINIHFSKRGVVFASFKINKYEPGSAIVYDYSIGNVLLDSLELDSGQSYRIIGISSGYIRLDDQAGTAEACWKVTFDDGSIIYLSVKDGRQLSIKK